MGQIHSELLNKNEWPDGYQVCQEYSFKQNSSVEDIIAKIQQYFVCVFDKAFSVPAANEVKSSKAGNFIVEELANLIPRKFSLFLKTYIILVREHDWLVLSGVRFKCFA